MPPLPVSLHQTPPTAQSDLATWLAYMGQIHVTAIDLGLERVRPVAQYLDLLTPAAPVIMVAGTNGKGSTSTTIAAIYQAAGLKVGLYQSPHIWHFNERIRLNSQPADDAAIVAACVQVEVARQACQCTLSFFEMTTLVAFLMFKQQRCDVWVVEVGLGGRLDVVNLLNADVAVITNIGLDHTDWLGDTLDAIAFEKAGIMRAGKPCIYAGQTYFKAIADRAAALPCPVWRIGTDIFYQIKDSHLVYSAPAINLTLKDYHLAPINIVTAISAVLAGPIQVQAHFIINGVAQARLAGRFEVRHQAIYNVYLKIVQTRVFILDVAHNTHGAQFLYDQLQQFLANQSEAQPKQVHAVFSMLADKDAASVVQIMAPLITHWHIAPLQNVRAASMEQLRQAVHQVLHSDYNDIQAALKGAVAASDVDDIILAFGSFHVIEALGVDTFEQ